jgi:hypothetical protein
MFEETFYYVSGSINKQVYAAGISVLFVGFNGSPCKANRVPFIVGITHAAQQTVGLL